LSGLFLSPDLFTFHLAVVFIFGAMIGSFLNVCIFRLPRGQSVNRPRRSFCPSCGTTIAWFDNIPVLSYVALGGLCRHCGSWISARYWLVELLTALLFSAVFWVHGYSLATPLFLILTAALIVSTFTDLDHWIIPDSVSLGGAAVGIAAALAISAIQATGRWGAAGRSLSVSYPFETFGAWGIAANALAGALFGFLLLWTVGVLGTLAFRKEAMGMGDMKLFACIGAFLGWQGCVLVLALASFLGATLGLSLIAAQWIVSKIAPAASSMASEANAATIGEPAADGATVTPAALATETPPHARPRGRQLHHLPFGPYIAVAGYLVALFYRPIVQWLMSHLFLLDLFSRR